MFQDTAQAADRRYFVRSPGGESINGYASPVTAEQAALQLGEGTHVVDALAPAYVPMIQQVIDGELRILGVGGWGANRLSLAQNFLQAIKRKQVAIVHTFLARGADPDTQDNKGRPAIIWAVASGQPEIVQLLLDKDANPDVTDRQGITALDLAVERGKQGVIALLQRAGTKG